MKKIAYIIAISLVTVSSMLLIYFLCFNNKTGTKKLVLNENIKTLIQKDQEINNIKLKLKLFNKESFMDTKNYSNYLKEVLEEYETLDYNIFNLNKYVDTSYLTKEEIIKNFLKLVLIHKIYAFNLSEENSKFLIDNSSIIKTNEIYQEYKKVSFLIESFKHKLFTFEVRSICSSSSSIYSNCIDSLNKERFLEMYNRYLNDTKISDATKQYLTRFYNWALK